MTSIPYESHLKIRDAVAPLLAGLQTAFRAQSYRTRLAYHAAKLALDTEATVWYYKSTPVEIVFTRSMGFVLLDHIRKLRSPGLNSLSDAIRARTNTLKEHENAPSSEVAASPDDAQAADRASA